MKKNSKRDIKIFSLGFLLCLILLCGITVYASNLISGSDVSFDNHDTNLTSTDVNGAISEIYGLLDTHCPTGYKCKKIEACEYALGKEWNFVYKGIVEEFKIPCDGLYKLEVYGAQGGSSSNGLAGGTGGYSLGYSYFSTDTSLYVAVGGKGLSGLNSLGGYNGGGSNGSGSHSNTSSYGGSGGGATHIAKVTGLLKDIGYTEFVTNKKGLIVAGGGGGHSTSNSGASNFAGVGGGLVGSGSTDHEGTKIGGGTQSGVGSGNWIGGFGYGANSPSNQYACYVGGGGGFYGGSASAYISGGGSGWIDGVPEISYDGTIYTPQTTAGVNSGDGKAKITLVSY